MTYICVFFSDLERELNDKQTSSHLLEREVSEGRKRCTELEEELDQVNKEIGEARVCIDRYMGQC
jgi:peptidoglycan hydrolase CwlO-like protein